MTALAQIALPVIIGFASVTAWSETATTQARTPESVKAEYFFLIARLTSWPAVISTATGGAVQLCVLGGDVDLYESLRAFEGESIRGKALRVRQYHRTAFLDDCAAVFVSRSEQAILPRVMAYFLERPILTVSDIRGFIELGGMIELIEESSRLRFLVNPWCAERVGLDIDPRLLALADNLGQLDDGACP